MNFTADQLNGLRHHSEIVFITKGNTIIHPGDTLVAFVDENYLGMVTETIQLISGEIQMP